MTSDLLPADDRLPFIVEEFGRQVHKVDWTPAPSRDPSTLHVRCNYAILPGAQIADVSWSGGLVTRASNVAETEMGDALFIYRERQSTAWFEMADGETHQTSPGSIILYPSDLSFYRGGIAEDRDYDFLIGTLPMSAFAPFGAVGHLRSIAHLHARDPFNALISSYFADWCRALPSLDGHRAEAATRTLINLLAVAGGAFDRREVEALEAVSAARVKAAERFIVANLQRPELTPKLVANHQGISVRQLHHDFEPSGLSVARRIQAGRVALARNLLVSQPHLTIIEVAYAAGFDGVSTFYRVFKAQTGTTASEYRREIVGARMAERQQTRHR